MSATFHRIGATRDPLVRMKARSQATGGSPDVRQPGAEPSTTMPRIRLWFEPEAVITTCINPPSVPPPGVSQAEVDALVIRDAGERAKASGAATAPGFFVFRHFLYHESADGKRARVGTPKVYHRWLRVYVARGQTNFGGVHHGVSGDTSDTAKSMWQKGRVAPDVFEHERTRAAIHTYSLNTFRTLRDQLAKRQAAGGDFVMTDAFLKRNPHIPRNFAEWGHADRVEFAYILATWVRYADSLALDTLVNFDEDPRDLRWLRVYELNPNYPPVATVSSWREPRPQSAEVLSERWMRERYYPSHQDNLRGVDTESLPGLATLLAYTENADPFLEEALYQVYWRQALIQLIETWRQFAEVK